jgi:hypothetical protein
MKMNDMTTENSSLILYYVPDINKNILTKQKEEIKFIKNELKFNSIKIIEGKESNVIYGKDIDSPTPPTIARWTRKLRDKPSITMP